MGTNIPKQPSVPKMPSYNSVKSELDLISREATLEAFADYVAHGMSMNDYDALEDIVIHMPSISTEKTGHWYLYEMFANGETILECSVCHNKHNKPWNYCPSCGARMEVEE